MEYVAQRLEVADLVLIAISMILIGTIRWWIDARYEEETYDISSDWSKKINDRITEVMAAKRRSDWIFWGSTLLILVCLVIGISMS